MPSPLVFPYPTYLQSYLPAANALAVLVGQSGPLISWDEVRCASETLLTAAGPHFPEDRRAVLDFHLNTDPCCPAGAVVGREVAERFLAKLRAGGFLPSGRREHARVGFARLLGMRGDWGQPSLDRLEEGVREIDQRHPTDMNDGGLKDGLHDLAATFAFFRRLRDDRPRVFDEISAFWTTWNTDPVQRASVSLAREEPLPEMPLIERLSALTETARMIGYLHIVARACINEEEALSWTRRQIDRLPERLEEDWFEAAACASIVFAHLQDVFDGGPGNMLKRFRGTEP
ncbi:MAG TPA: hypothetical protein VLJ37_07435 [bacterium]|nr:hypothetical protein [bacterium]